MDIFYAHARIWRIYIHLWWFMYTHEVITSRENNAIYKCIMGNNYQQQCVQQCHYCNVLAVFDVWKSTNKHISAPSPPPTPIPKPIPRGTAVGPCPSATSWVFGGCVQPQHSRVSFGASPRPSRCPKWRHSGPAGLMWHGGGICWGGGSPTKSWGSLR